MRKILGIAGPTGVGKSRLGMTLAEKMGTDIISADSAQIYIGMDIGTAKPDREEQNRVRHHLIDIVRPDEENFNAFAFSKAAETVINENTYKQPLIVGGTGLYFETLFYGLDFSVTEETFKIRKELKSFYENTAKTRFTKSFWRRIPKAQKTCINTM